jgi:hypothetical protein
MMASGVQKKKRDRQTVRVTMSVSASSQDFNDRLPVKGRAGGCSPTSNRIFIGHSDQPIPSPPPFPSSFIMSEPMTANASATGTPKRSRSPTPPPPASTDAPNMETATAFSSPSAPPPAKQAKIGAVEPDATANLTPAASTVAEESSVVASPDTAGADAAASEAQKATGRKAKKPARRWEGKEKPRKTRNDDNSWDNPDRPKSDAPRLPKKVRPPIMGDQRPI